MKRAYGTFAAVFVVAIGALYAYNGYSSDDYSASSFLQWLESWITRAELKITGRTNPDAADIAADLIAGFEGFRSKVYLDIAGFPTIGYGHRLVAGDGLDMNSVISEAQGRALLISDIQRFVDCVESTVKAGLTPRQEAALISLAYNIGCNAFIGSSLVRALNNGDYQTASDDFLSWDKAHEGGILVEVPDLLSRRQSEQQVFNS